ncbi:MAG: septum formation inhibitor Maf [Dehalococcoidales bacterium]|nr:septum formation inhibitor Maf [Dehalococcoidales bacterium]
MKKIILASGSPRRKELLEKIGLKFEVEAGDIEEDLNVGLPPRELAEKLSLQKAQAAAEKYPDAIIIAADTIGVFEGKIIGKPHAATEAKKMLSMLSGKSHLVITGYTIIDTETRKTVTKSIETKVYFRKLTKAEIDAYVKTGEPLDKAGAYAIQGLGALIVEKIEGDYYNVIGLPLSSLTESLREFGVKIL